MVVQKAINLLGYASGIAGEHSTSGDGPLVLEKSLYMAQAGLDLSWKAMIRVQSEAQSKLAIVTELCDMLAKDVAALVDQKQFFTVMGGDHSCAIGTWSGASHAKSHIGPIGLIWIDAHMDSHTPETSQTGNFHGMPLACLLGHGEKSLTTLLNPSAKLKPEHVCLIGIRSYEAGEAALLDRLNIRIFYMDEVKSRGLSAVMKDAIRIATNNTCGYGVSIDIDSMDPSDAPGTGVAEHDGLSAAALCEALTQVAQDDRLIGTEIAEFDPSLDQDHKTEKLIPKLLSAMMLGKIMS